jgi:hypothetical protein
MEAKPTIPVRVSKRTILNRKKKGSNLTAKHVCNAHLMVIDDRCKVVSGEKIRFEQDGVCWEGRVRVAQTAKDEVWLWFSAHREHRVLDA